MKFGVLIRRLLKLQPYARSLIRRDGRRHNRIRGDLVSARCLVIVEDGRVFVRTDELDGDGCEIYREGHRTHERTLWS